MARTKAGPTRRAHLTASQVLVRIRGEGFVVPQAHVQATLAEIDQDAIRAKHRDRFEWEVWDRAGSPVEGLNLEEFEASQRANGWDASSAIYLCYVDGTLNVIQPHAPGVSGFQPMAHNEAREHAASEVAEFAQDRADEEIVGLVRAELDQSSG